jgi:aerotaxis receptor
MDSSFKVLYMENPVVVDEEYSFGSDVIISQTDINGVVTYVNRAFCSVSGFSVDELIGQSHNIVRHPDMPRGIFTKLWETIAGGQAWNGLIKDKRKDGKFYWLETEILPVRDEDEVITGFIAVQKAPSNKDINETQETYMKMLETQNQEGKTDANL